MPLTNPSLCFTSLQVWHLSHGLATPWHHQAEDTGTQCRQRYGIRTPTFKNRRDLTFFFFSICQTLCSGKLSSAQASSRAQRTPPATCLSGAGNRWHLRPFLCPQHLSPICRRIIPCLLLLCSWKIAENGLGRLARVSGRALDEPSRRPGDKSI